MSGELTAHEAKTLRDLLQWSGADTATPFHLAAESIQASVVNVRLAATMPDRSPAAVEKARQIITPLFIARSEVDHANQLRRKASERARERKATKEYAP